MTLAQTREDWAVGFADETWWSRVAQPALHTWSDGEAVRLVAPTVVRSDPDPKALACYGILVRLGAEVTEDLWLRLVEGRPVSALTIAFLAWCAECAAARGVTTLLLIWDNASWHGSRAVHTWLRDHNQRVHREGGVRLIPCFLPSKSPWLNPSEPK